MSIYLIKKNELHEVNEHLYTILMSKLIYQIYSGLRFQRRSTKFLQVNVSAHKESTIGNCLLHSVSLLFSVNNIHTAKDILYALNVILLFRIKFFIGTKI